MLLLFLDSSCHEIQQNNSLSQVRVAASHHCAKSVWNKTASLSTGKQLGMLCHGISSL